MSELLFFVLGLMVGGLIGIVLMCVLQINRLNEIENKYRRLIKSQSGGKDGKS